jgi:dephospho-CoA kinase
MEKKLVIGLTGGIGSGKTTVADEFAKLGATIVDTDAIAHELTGAKGLAVAEIRKLFGANALGPDGAMDRKRMRDQVFADPEAKKKLERLLHPMIREESAHRIAAAQGLYVVHVIPLLVESGDYRQRVDRVLVVDCPEEQQVARVRERGLSDREARAILMAQAPRAARLAAADDVIDNGGARDALRKQVAALHQKYLQFASP